MDDLRFRLRGLNFLFLFMTALIFCPFVFAEKITVLYTGETHSMLYPCECPLGFNGGVAKRAAEIKKARKDNPNVLLVDSGGMFAGGLLDEYTQSVELDKKRTMVNLEAIKLMGYDAVAIGDEEFNFGEDFLSNVAQEKKIPFLSSNLENDYAQAFLIKSIGKIKVGILALANSEEIKNKGIALKYLFPREALEKNINLAKNQGAEIILVLSHLGEENDLTLIREIEGVDIWIFGHRTVNSPPPETKINDTIILRPAWQGKKLGRLNLDIENGKIKNYSIDDVLIDKKTVIDDPEVAKILPKCFSDNDCRENGAFGVCENAATPLAKCVFKEPKPVSVLIIRPTACSTCDTERALDVLRKTLPALRVSYLYAETREAQNFLTKNKIEMLPAYLLGKEVEKDRNFSGFSKFLMLKEDRYLVDPALLGVSSFVGRAREKGQLDLFISLFDANARPLLEMIKEFTQENKNIKFKLHFLGLVDKERIITPYGLPEFEENVRSVCVMEKYPEKWWDYLLCRVKNTQSTWWDFCMDSCGINVNYIKQCSNSAEGKRLLLENISLSGELKIRTSGAFLLDNQEVFTTPKTPTKEEMERVIK